MRNQMIAIPFILVVILSTASLNGAERITATAIPIHAQIIFGQTLEVPVVINLSGLPERLGSFTATLSWNPEVLHYEGCSGGTTKGFENPTVNSSNVKHGKLIFAHAQPNGAEGSVNVLNVKFKVIGKTGSSSALDLGFKAMAAAVTFHDLLPYLDLSNNGKEDLKVTKVPETYALGQNYPNPFNPETKITYQLPKDGFVHIAVYNLLGQQVRILVNRNKLVGSHVVRWDGKDDRGQVVPSGLYILQMKAGNFIAKRKMLFLK